MVEVDENNLRLVCFRKVCKQLHTLLSKGMSYLAHVAARQFTVGKKRGIEQRIVDFPDQLTNVDVPFGPLVDVRNEKCGLVRAIDSIANGLGIFIPVRYL